MTLLLPFRDRLEEAAVPAFSPIEALDTARLAVTLERVDDVNALAPAWRALEKVADGGFFRSWSWIGCLAAERYDRPVLLRAERAGHTVALALCNQRGTRWSAQTLYLHETGNPVWDSIFTEHNGPLHVGGAPVLHAVLKALLQAPLGADGLAGGRRVVLAGIGTDVADGAHRLGSACHLRQTRLAPLVNLRALAGLDDLIDGLGRSARHQLRRAIRLYETVGPLTLARAETVSVARSWFDRMVALHQASWNARGKPGAFAADQVQRFHRALLSEAHPRGELDVLRIAAGEEEIGYLYMFRSGGRVHAYQSGFVYEDDARKKPGMVCHALAIGHYRAEGLSEYDFLAGNDRYKRTFAREEEPMHWVELVKLLSPRGVALRLAALRAGFG